MAAAIIEYYNSAVRSGCISEVAVSRVAVYVIS